MCRPAMQTRDRQSSVQACDLPERIGASKQATLGTWPVALIVPHQAPCRFELCLYTTKLAKLTEPKLAREEMPT